MYEDLDIVERKYKMSDFPLNLIVEPGNYCNLNCTTCAHDKLTRPKGSMDIRLYKKIIDEVAKENPYTRIWLDFYGEPLIQKFKIFYMVAYAKAQGIKNIEMNTNATLLDKEMTEMLLDSGIDFISIDCDGFSKEVYEKIRVNAKRDVTYSNIEYFIHRKKEAGLKKPRIEIKIMEMDENRHEIDQIIQYFRNIGDVLITKRRLISWAGQVSEIIPQTSHERIACGNAVGTLAITWNGDAASCVMDIDATKTYGNVWNSSIKEIWEKRNENMVRKHLEHKWNELPEICKNCMDWAIIGEDRYDEHGQPIEKNYEQTAEMLSPAGR